MSNHRATIAKCLRTLMSNHEQPSSNHLTWHYEQPSNRPPKGTVRLLSPGSITPIGGRSSALLRRPPRWLFECPCDQCQGYATDDPDEPDLDDV